MHTQTKPYKLIRTKRIDLEEKRRMRQQRKRENIKTIALLVWYGVLSIAAAGWILGGYWLLWIIMGR